MTKVGGTSLLLCIMAFHPKTSRLYNEGYYIGAFFVQLSYRAGCCNHCYCAQNAGTAIDNLLRHPYFLREDKLMLFMLSVAKSFFEFY